MPRFNRSFLWHAALTVVHIATCIILLLESAFAAAIYGVLSDGHRPRKPSGRVTSSDGAPDGTRYDTPPK